MNKYLLPLAVIISTSIGLGSYNHFIGPETISDEGFQGATATSSNGYVCKADDYNCVRRIIIDLDKSSNNLLILGNSQLGAINQISSGDINYAHKLAIDFENTKINNLVIRSIWIPNSSLSEFNLIYSSISDCSGNVKNLIIPLFLDDTRESSIRPSLENYMYKICGIDSGLLSSKVSKEAKSETITNSKRIGDKIINIIPILKETKSTNTSLRTFLYKLRNTIFNVNPSTKRRTIKSAYNTNIKSLRHLISSRKGSQGFTITYIPPLLYSSNLNLIPYIPSEYTLFKNQMLKLCQYNGCYLYNLEALIPDHLWGSKESTSFTEKSAELDFMHFTYEGHHIFFNKLKMLINSLDKPI